MLVCHRLQSNAYRILGVSVDSTAPQVLNAGAALKRAAMMEVMTPEFDCFGEIVRSEATIRAALGALGNPAERLQHRLFWLHGAIWLESSLGAGPRPKLDRPQSLHEGALRALIAAYHSEDLPQLVAALRQWAAFLAQPEYPALLAESELQAGFEPAATAAEIEALRQNAMAFAAEPLAVAARAAWAKAAVSPFRESLAALRQLADTGPWAAACRQDLLFALTRRLADACATLEGSYRSQIGRRAAAAASNRTLCAAELHYFRQHIEPAWKDLEAVLASTDEELLLARGEAADALRLIALDHTWADEIAMTEELAVEAVALAKGTVQAERIRADLEKYLKAQQERTLRAALQVFQSEFPLGSSASTREQAAAAAALKFYRDSIEPLLNQLLAQSAHRPQAREQLRSTGASCLLSIAQTLAAAEEFIQAEALMGEALPLAEGTDAAATLQQELVKIRQMADTVRTCKADEAVALEAIKRVRQYCRTLAHWPGKVVEQPGHAAQNQVVAGEERVFFEIHLAPALQQATLLLGNQDPRIAPVRAEAAHALAEIAIHHTWASDMTKAAALFQQAVQLAVGTNALEVIRQNYRRRGALIEEVSPGAHEGPPTPYDEPYYPFPGKLPLFATDYWRLGAVVTVLIALLVACVAGFEGKSLSGGMAPLPSPAPAAPRLQQVSRGPLPIEEQGAPVVVDPLAGPADLKLRELLVQIHAEERTAQQIERQLEPLREEIDSMKRYAAETSQPESAALQDKEDIYNRLLERQQNVIWQWKQNTHARDQLIAARAPHVRAKRAKEGGG
jgi:hypothetical protein